MDDESELVRAIRKGRLEGGYKERTNERTSLCVRLSLLSSELTTEATLLVNKDARKFYLRANTPRRPRCVQNPRPRPSPASPIRVMHSRKYPSESLCAFSAPLCGVPISRDENEEEGRVCLRERERERGRERHFPLSVNDAT